MAEADDGRYEALVDSVLQYNSHALVSGGAGSGKTTTALRKASHIVESGLPYPHSRVIFLSFANATINRVAQHAATKVGLEQLPFIEFSTYHSFAWSIIRSHGYLLCSGRAVRILSKGEQNAFEIDSINDPARKHEALRALFRSTGLVALDLFAELANDLLNLSEKLRKAYAVAYPTIILDEFQDTTESQWRLTQTLGINSRLIALGDPDQRIYEFAGASPERFPEFRAAFAPLEVDFSGFNWRSPEGSIAAYGRDILRGTVRNEEYPGVSLREYDYPPFYKLKSSVLTAVARLRKKRRDWTIAILVTSNAQSVQLYDYLRGDGDGLPPVYADIHVGADEASAASIFVAVVLECEDATDASLVVVIRAFMEYLRTRSSKFSIESKKICVQLETQILKIETHGRSERSVVAVAALLELLEGSMKASRTGGASADQLTTAALAAGSTFAPLKKVAAHARYINLIRRGSELESQLSAVWRTTGTYRGAGELMRAAVLQHLLNSSKSVQSHITVMTIHRAKGKEFDEVFVYEGKYNPFIGKGTSSDLRNAKYNLNVAVTRARERVRLFTPSSNPSPLLLAAGPSKDA